MTNATPRLQITEWAQRIWTASTKTAAATLALGRELLDAKADLGHGNFGRLFREHPHAIADPLPFSQSRADRYMHLARAFAQYSAHAPILPTSVRALLQLAKLPAHQCHAAIVDGLVHPSMTEKAARALLSTSPPPTVEWSLESVKQAVQALRKAISNTPPGLETQIMDLVRSLMEELEEASRPERHAVAAIAKDELSMRDAEPGGFKVFEGAGESGLHAGSPAVIASCPSTYPDWYRSLTTAQPGVTALRRKQVEARLDDIEAGKLPTARTAHTHEAVAWAIKDLPRTSPLGRGGSGS